LKVLQKYSGSPGNHNLLVNFFKSYESLCLYRADIISSGVVNWGPIIDCVREMIDLSNKFSAGDDKLDDVLATLIDSVEISDQETLLSQVLSAILPLSDIELLEASTLHKFLFYAEVDVNKGLDKIFRRTHTKRKVDKEYMIDLVGVTKQEFILRFYEKHRAIPEIIKPIEKAVVINQHLANGEIQELRDYPYTWWYDIKVGKCMEFLSARNPVEFSKDKGAITNSIRFHPSDNVRELTQVMSDPDYEAQDILDDITPYKYRSKVYRTSSRQLAKNVPMPVRLNEKEKEQKVEARLFGIGTARFKHKLSEYMEKAKKVLAYYKGSFMTMSSKERTDSLHDSAQRVMVKNRVALLLDIEGHNQSMQPDNTSEILEFIGNTYGEEGWGDLSHIFSNLTVYHYNTYADIVTVSQGQFGGIEGWMNPVWTLVTLQQMKLLESHIGIQVEKIDVYSDDVELIIIQDDQTISALDLLLRRISIDIARGGFIMKPSQTAITGSRVTMLRQHYINGQRADNTLKRLLATTSANNNIVVSDEIELDGISSSCSSAMDGTYHVNTVIFLKWFRSCILMLRTFTMLFEKPHDSSIISHDALPSHISSILYNKDAVNSIPLDNAELDVGESFKEYFQLLRRNFGQTESIEIIEGWINYISMNTLDSVKAINMFDSLTYLLEHERYLQVLFWMLLSLPNNVGGGGVELAINQAMSGHSDNTMKVIYYIHRGIGFEPKDKAAFFSVLEVALKQHSVQSSKDLDNQVDDLEEIDQDIARMSDLSAKNIISNRWFTNRRISSATSGVQSLLLSEMRKRNKNKAIQRLLDHIPMIETLASYLVGLFQENFSHRVIQFYFENSIVSMIQFLVKKLEMTMSLLRRARGIASLRARLTTKTRDNFRELLSTQGVKFGKINQTTDILTYLKQRRQLLCPHIKFIDIEEPLYDHLLIVNKNPGRDTVLDVHLSHRDEYRNGVFGMKRGSFVAQTLYKGEIKEDDILLTARQEMLIAKLISVTKWGVLKSSPSLETTMAGTQFDFILACNASLITHTELKFSDLADSVPLNLGGEIIHRIPNQKFKSQVATRILPNSTQQVQVSLDQTTINNLGIQDSNVNFEYIRLLIVIRKALLIKYKKVFPLFEEFKFISMENIKDVQDYKPREMKTKAYDPGMKTDLMKVIPGFVESVSLASTAYLYHDNIGEFLSTAGAPVLDHTLSAIEARNESISYEYYKLLSKEMLVLDLKLTNESLWRPLISKLRIIDNRFLLLTDEEVYDYIVRAINNRLHGIEFSNHLSKHRKRMEGKLNQIRSTQCQFSSAYRTYAELLKRAKIRTNEERTHFNNTNIIRKIKNHIDSLTEDVFRDLAFGYNLHLQKYSGILQLDVASTYRAVVHTCEEGNFNTNIPNRIKETMMLIGPYRLVQELTSKAEYFFEILEQARSETKEEIGELKTLNTKFPTTLLQDYELKIPDDISRVRYTSFEISLGDLKDWDKIQKACRVIEQIVDIYSDTGVFSSPTGSDSLVGQYGAYKAMIDEGILIKGVSTCSLASGRGDGKLALDLLDFVADHYSKPTIFSRTSVVPGLILEYDFDLTQWTSLEFIYRYDQIIIDLSHLSGSHLGLLDSLLNLLVLSKTVIVRLNSLPELTASFIIELEKFRPNLKIFHACSGTFRPYQIYLVIKPFQTIILESEDGIQGSAGYREMIRGFFSMIKLENFYKLPTSKAQNSITKLLPEIWHMRTLVEVTDSLVKDDIVIRSLSKLIDHAYLEDEVKLDTRTYKYSLKKEKLHKISFFERYYGNPYSTYSIDDIGSKKSKSYKHWVNAITQSAKKNEGYWYAKRNDITYEEWIMISRHHPVRDERVYASNLVSLYDEGFDLLKGDYELINGLYDEKLKSGSTMPGKISKNIRETFAIMLLSANKNNYQWGLNTLLPDKKVSLHTHRDSLEKLKMYRKLAPVFLALVHDNENVNITIQRIASLEEKIIKPKTLSRDKIFETELGATEGIDHTLLKEELERTMTSGFDAILDGQTSIAPTLVNTKALESFGNKKEMEMGQVTKDNLTTNHNDILSILPTSDLDLIVNSELGMKNLMDVFTEKLANIDMEYDKSFRWEDDNFEEDPNW